MAEFCSASRILPALLIMSALWAGEITNCTIISSPGTYYLNGPISGLDMENPEFSGLGEEFGMCAVSTLISFGSSSRLDHYGCIQIRSSDVTLDCRGNSLTNEFFGPGVITSGVILGFESQDFRGITVQNCNISGYNMGIVSSGTNGSRFVNNSVSGGNIGMYLCSSDGSVVSENIAEGNEYGFSTLWSRCSFYGNRAYRNHYGFKVDSSIMRNNTASYNDIGVDASYDTYLEDNLALSNEDTGFHGSMNSTLANNFASGSDGCFVVGTHSTAIGNEARDCETGFVVSSDHAKNIGEMATAINNTAHGCEEGFQPWDNAFLENNTAYDNDEGFVLEDDSILKGNIAYGNRIGFNITGACHEERLGTSCHFPEGNTLIGNIARNNTECGFCIYGPFENNIFTLNSNVAEQNGKDMDIKLRPLQYVCIGCVPVLLLLCALYYALRRRNAGPTRK